MQKIVPELCLLSMEFDDSSVHSAANLWCHLVPRSSNTVYTIKTTALMKLSWTVADQWTLWPSFKHFRMKLADIIDNARRCWMEVGHCGESCRLGLARLFDRLILSKHLLQTVDFFLNEFSTWWQTSSYNVLPIKQHLKTVVATRVTQACSCNVMFCRSACDCRSISCCRSVGYVVASGVLLLFCSEGLNKEMFVFENRRGESIQSRQVRMRAERHGNQLAGTMAQ